MAYKYSDSELNQIAKEMGYSNYDDLVNASLDGEYKYNSSTGYATKKSGVKVNVDKIAEKVRSGGSSNRSTSTGNNDYSYTDTSSNEQESTGNNDYSYGGDGVNQPAGSGSMNNINFDKLVNIGIIFMVLNLVISIFKS